MVGVAESPNQVSLSGERVMWDACSKAVGGAARARWESLLEMEAFGLTERRGEQMISRDVAVAFVVDLAKAFGCAT